MLRPSAVLLFPGLLVLLHCAVMLAAQPTSTARRSRPDFGPNVYLFDPHQDRGEIQKQIDDLFKTQEAGQFNDRRCALLFMPGEYELDVQVGFYTQVAGLGSSPDNASIRGAVRSKARWMRNNNATCNFWRSAENLCVTPSVEGNVNVWAVSQGTALRRVHVKGDVRLSDGGWSSGGFLADSVIDGTIDSGSQQQWFSRNAEWGNWIGGNWNMVFLGTRNPPAGDWPDRPYTTIDKTPLIREKPFLFVNSAGEFRVFVPALSRDGSKGITWKSGETPGDSISIDRFYVARSDRDDARTINAALEAGRHLLLTPGIYHLDAPLRVTAPDTIVLGIGYATLVPDRGTAALTIADVDGVKVGGLLVEASEISSPSLIEVGAKGSRKPHNDNPIFLYDIFCRVGGAVVGRADCMMTINSSNVVGDNFWLWRADHGTGAKWDTNTNRNGLIVNGGDVTIYGLFVEHCQEYQTVWNGERGRVYFYQSEMPYDPPAPEAWTHDGVRGYASYKVADNVRSHEAWGVGVYCVFWHAPIIADSAIEAPDVPGVKMHDLITIRLNGKPNSGIAHVINGRGDAVITTKESRLK